MADKLSNLTDSVPKIVITEPSPMPITKSGLVQNVLHMADEVKAVVPNTAPVPEPAVAVSKEDPVLEPKVREDYIVETVSISGSDTDSCSVSVEQKVQEVTMEVEEAGLLTPPQHEEATDDDFINVPVHEGVYNSCYRWLDNFSESKFMLPILIMLLAMPISAGLMGARYMDKCPLSAATPLFLFMMGILGTLVILCRMACIVQKMAMFGSGDHKMLGTVIVFGNLAILLLLCTEMTSFLRISPNFEPGAPNYCHRIFYNFTYWLNWTSLFVIVFLTIVHAPKFSRQASQVETVA